MLEMSSQEIKEIQENSNKVPSKFLRNSNDKIISNNKNIRQKNAVNAQTETKVKDELEYATNWRRAFQNLFTKLKWLNAFAQINYIAL